MFLKAVRVQNSVRIGMKEESYITDDKYDIFLDVDTRLIYVRHKIQKDANIVTGMDNVPYVVARQFPHHLLDKVEEKRGFTEVKKPAGKREIKNPLSGSGDQASL